MKPQPEQRVTVITLKGNLSGESIKFDTTLIRRLIDAYCVHVPNEIRKTETVFTMVHFYDDLLRVSKAEELAGLEIIEKTALKEDDR